MSLPANLNRIRKKFRMSQERFGELLGLSRDQVKRLENGQMEASVSVAVKLEKLSGISVKRLFSEMVADAEIPSFPEGQVDVVREPDNEIGYGKKSEQADFVALMNLLLRLQKKVEEQEERIAKLEEERKKGRVF